MCNNYKTFGKSVDTSHWIEARQLYECVLGDIRKHAAEALADNDELCRKLAGQIGTDKAKQVKTLEKELRAKKTRLSEVDNLFQSLYEDKLNGKISEHNYQMMSGGMRKNRFHWNRQSVRWKSSARKAAGKRTISSSLPG
ncbi:MAG: hypothetical protein K2N87_04500 [Eubacterium sp.]|nr:hypothetical protein [Eubacterium sp.]